MMIRIGIAAGEILNLLEEKKYPVSILEITSRVNESMDVINMSIEDSNPGT